MGGDRFIVRSATVQRRASQPPSLADRDVAYSPAVGRHDALRDHIASACVLIIGIISVVVIRVAIAIVAEPQAQAEPNSRTAKAAATEPTAKAATTAAEASTKAPVTTATGLTVVVAKTRIASRKPKPRFRLQRRNVENGSMAGSRAV